MSKKITSVELTQPAGEATGGVKKYNIPDSDGPVYGVSLSSNYSVTDNGKLYLTLEHGGIKHLDEVPANQLIAGSGFRFQDIDPKLENGEIKMTIKSITAASAAANPLRLILHHEK